MTTQFPRTFAIFDAGAAVQEPYHNNRYKLYRTVHVPLGTGDIAVSSRLIEERHTCVLQECERSSPSLTLFQTGGASNEFIVSAWWQTGYKLIVPGLIPGLELAVPVLDVAHRRQLFPEPYTQSAEGDRPGWCMDRQERQNSLREQMLQTVSLHAEMPGWVMGGLGESRRQQKPANSVSQAGPIPKFVAELIMKNAKETSATCPISMNSPEECERIAITNCFHWFDANSLEQWMKRGRHCPVCKTEVQFFDSRSDLSF